MAELTQRSGHPPSWADIPRDLAGLVLRLLPAYAECARFATVCPQRRCRRTAASPALAAAAACSPGRHLLQPSLRQALPFPGLRLRRLQDGCLWWLARLPARPWMLRGRSILWGQSDAPCSVSHPVTSAQYNAVAKYVDYEDDNIKIADPYTWMHLKEEAEMPTLSKLILCSPNLVAAFVGNAPLSQIPVCQPGASSWSVCAIDMCRLFEDMAFYQGKLYAITVDEDLLVINISQDPRTGDPQVSRIGHVIKGDPWYSVVFPNKTMARKKLYLVESHDALLMVRRKVWCKIKDDSVVAFTGEDEFEVFKADLEHSRWVNQTTLGNEQMLFLGRPFSKAVSASQYGMSGDQIFFLDDQLDEESTSVGVYDMKTSKVSFPMPMFWKREVIPATWLFP